MTYAPVIVQSHPPPAGTQGDSDRILTQGTLTDNFRLYVDVWLEYVELFGWSQAYLTSSRTGRNRAVHNPRWRPYMNDNSYYHNT